MHNSQFNRSIVSRPCIKRSKSLDVYKRQMYNQGSFQTGFYDVRYVHNAFGQALYDMGWIGLISFIIVFIVGLIVILKGSHKRKLYYTALYLTIYCHSILDFNFAYMFTILVIALIVGIAGKENIDVELNTKPIFIPVAVIALYISTLSIMNFSAPVSYTHLDVYKRQGMTW